jgi:adenylylsulfate kinase-like enzyme
LRSGDATENPSQEIGTDVRLLDGDLVRKHLSSELSFSKEHRDINIRRIGHDASEITKNGGITIRTDCAVRFHAQGRAGDDRAV